MLIPRRAGHEAGPVSAMAMSTQVPNFLSEEAAALRVALPSFEGVYDAHVDFVYRSALRMGIDDAAVDDVVQNVFVVVHRQLSAFQGRASLKTWLFAILPHVVRDHRRSLRRKSPHLAKPLSE